MKKKRVGLKQAKKIFHRRSKQSQARDRAKTSKHTVYPWSKQSHQWKQHPNRYDMHGVDTKPVIPKKIIQGEIYTSFGTMQTSKKGIQTIKQETLAGFSNKTFIPNTITMKQLKKSSGIKAHYRKTKKGYTLYIRPKQSMHIPHFVIMEAQKKRQKQ